MRVKLKDLLLTMARLNSQKLKKLKKFRNQYKKIKVEGPVKVRMKIARVVVVMSQKLKRS